MRLKIRRLLASLVDYAIILIILMTPVIIISKLLFKVSFVSNNPSVLYIPFPLVMVMIIALWQAIYRKDLIFKNVSIGKKIYQLEIVDKNGKVLTDREILIKRNKESMELMNFPLYPFMILINNKSYGDSKYNTKVIMREKTNILPEVITVIVFVLLQIISLLS